MGSCYSQSEPVMGNKYSPHDCNSWVRVRLGAKLRGSYWILYLDAINVTDSILVEIENYERVNWIKAFAVHGYGMIVWRKEPSKKKSFPP